MYCLARSCTLKKREGSQQLVGPDVSRRLSAIWPVNDFPPSLSCRPPPCTWPSRPSLSGGARVRALRPASVSRAAGRFIYDLYDGAVGRALHPPLSKIRTADELDHDDQIGDELRSPQVGRRNRECGPFHNERSESSHDASCQQIPSSRQLPSDKVSARAMLIAAPADAARPITNASWRGPSARPWRIKARASRRNRP